MRSALFLLILLISFPAYTNSRDEAMNKLAEAFSKTETGKTAIKNIEKTINNNLPVEKKTAALIGSTAATIAQGKIDTKHVKNINVKMFKGSVRPDAEYDFKEQNTSITLKYNLDF